MGEEPRTPVTGEFGHGKASATRGVYAVRISRVVFRTPRPCRTARLPHHPIAQIHLVRLFVGRGVEEMQAGRIRAEEVVPPFNGCEDSVTADDEGPDRQKN